MTGLTTMTVVLPSHVARWLKAIRKKQGWTVRKAAKMASISPSTFSRVENRKPMDAVTFLRLSSFIVLWWYR